MAADGDLIGWPVTDHTPSTGFGYRSDPFTHRQRWHDGVDLGQPCGDPAWASLDGTVVDAGWAGGYGNRVVVRHADRDGHSFATTYNHLAKIEVTVGDQVTRGQVVGRIGSTGRSTACHMHFEVILDGSYVDPMRFLTGDMSKAALSRRVGSYMPSGLPSPTLLDPTSTPTVTPSPDADHGQPVTDAHHPDPVAGHHDSDTEPDREHLARHADADATTPTPTPTTPTPTPTPTGTTSPQRAASATPTGGATGTTRQRDGPRPPVPSTPQCAHHRRARSPAARVDVLRQPPSASRHIGHGSPARRRQSAVAATGTVPGFAPGLSGRARLPRYDPGSRASNGRRRSSRSGRR